MELEFSTEFRTGFNGKVSSIEVVIQGKVGNVKRTIRDFVEDYRLERTPQHRFGLSFNNIEKQLFICSPEITSL